MNIDAEYIIAIESLDIGTYTYEFELDKAFFEAIEYADFIAEVNIVLELVKQGSTMELRFDIKGKVFTDCDRCLREIALPVEESYTLLVKYGEGTDEGEIAFIPYGTTEIDVSHYLYEFTGLSVPMSHVCADTELGQCPENIRDILDKEQVVKTDERKSDVWKALDDLTFDNKD